MAPRKHSVCFTIDQKLYKDLQLQFGKQGTDLETYLKLQLSAIRKIKVVLKLADPIPFGKYSGEKIEDITRADTSYMKWLVTTSKNPGQFHQEILKLIAELDKIALA